ncbi:MAG TPA: hypothetical protein VII38_02740 [Polyangia bacterium]|jgi:hypothetical protein
MRNLTAILTALALSAAPLTASAKKKAPQKPAAPITAPAKITPAPAAAVTVAAPDPGRDLKLAGIITADIGAGALAAGVIMLGVSTTVNDNLGKRQGLDLGGGLLTGVGASAMLIGALIWLDGRKTTSDAKAKTTALILPAASPTSAGAVALVRF